MTQRIDHLINGKTVAGTDYFETINPATQGVLAEVASGTEAEVNAAVQAAKDAFPAWAGLPATERAKKIRALGSDTYGYVISGGCGGCNIFEFTPHIWASGGDVLSADGKHAQLDSPQVADALRFYRELYTAGTMPDLAKTDNGANASADFLAGKIGMIPLGAFFVQSIKAAKGLDVGVAPLPGKDGGSSSFAGGDEIALAKGARNKAKALDFITWATGTQAQTILADNGIVPVRTDLIPTIYAPKDPMNKVLGDAMATGRTPYSTVENSLFNDNNGPWIKMIDQAVFGGDIAGAQAAAQKQAQAIIDGSR